MRFTPATLRWLEVVLAERFGHDFHLEESDTTLVLTLPGAEGRITFDVLQDAFQSARSDFPCSMWDSAGEGFDAPLDREIPAPGAAELASPLIELDPASGSARIHFDIPGLTYWMLGRREEIGRRDLDEHQRFPATASHAYRHGYLERPIVDEWLVILGQVIVRVWPGMKLRAHAFEMKVSHDVDEPARYAFRSPARVMRMIGSDLIRRADPKSAMTGAWVWLRGGKRLHPADPCSTFDFLMSQSERNGLRSAFYFLCGRTDASKDARYDPEMPQIRSLIREIHGRGHEIGLHPSYNTFECPGEIAREAQRLRAVCAEEGVVQSEWGGRMHYLRWSQAITLRAWSDAGMSYDSTLGYADRPGFRCGTCFEYPAFDIETDTMLALRVRPLIAMDCTVMEDRYLGLGSTDAAYRRFAQLKQTCRRLGGVFTLLWHNSQFHCAEDFRIYQRLIDANGAAQ